MYYKDLSCYRDGDLNDEEIYVYPSIRNIGWLGEASFELGDIPSSLIQKLREILFLDLKNNHSKKNGVYKESNVVNVHCMHIRGSAYECPLCDSPNAIEYEPINLEYYLGRDRMKAGLNEVCIPSSNESKYYSFPTMLLHYIEEHKYRPPQEFLSALEAFDISKPYDIDKALEEVEVFKISSSDWCKW